MIYNFDTSIERRSTNSAKWTFMPPDVLPLWVADMDFPTAEPILRALHERVDHGIFGYQFDSPSLREAIVAWFAARYAAAIETQEIVFVPGLVTALNLVSRITGETGSGVLVQTPIYPPFLHVPENTNRSSITAPLTITRTGSTIRAEIDWDVLESAVTPETRMFILCNPHNPVGRVYTRPELERLAEFVIRHDLLLVSDEIHADLTYAPHKHITAPAIAPELRSRLITLGAPSKAFNLAGIPCGFAIIHNESLRRRFMNESFGSGVFPSNAGFTASEAAYREGGDWLDQALVYLQANRDFMEAYLTERLPEAAFTHVEGTYLGWIDLSAYQLPGGAFKFCIEEAKVGLNDGATFGGAAYKDYVRINFGCPRSTLKMALDRVVDAIANREMA